MKQYKLIKEYPCSPILGTTINFERKDSWYAHFIPKMLSDEDDDNIKSIGCAEILEYSEYWQEIKQKEYEITGYIDHINRIVKYYDTGSKIYSVKRLSDNVEFKIGDKVIIGNITMFNYIIDSFQIIDNRIAIHFTQSTNCIMLNNIDHIKQPLFKTEDSVDIYEGDEFYFIPIISEGYGTLTAKPDATAKYAMLRFSTKELAKEYVIMNKPCLSLKEVEDIFYNHTNNFFTKKLRSFVKDKICI